MPYTSLPNSGQSLGQTRDAIRNNFDLIKTTVDQNHVDFDAAGPGKHYCIQMPVQGAIPANPLPPLGLVAGDANVYSKTASAASQIFFSPDASGNEYQMTRAITASFAKFATNTAYIANHTGGWTFLPGGMIMQYGIRSSPGASGVITLPVAFTNAPYSITLTLLRNSGSQSVTVDSGTIPTTTTINYLVSSAGSVGIYWTAIGV